MTRGGPSCWLPPCSPGTGGGGPGRNGPPVLPRLRPPRRDHLRWGRDAVRTGPNELRSGIRGVEDFESRGRPTTEELHPELEEHIRRLLDPHTQADPKFQTAFAYTRITATAVREALRAIPELAGAVPTRQTVGDILNRLGYKLRRVLDGRPQKRCPRRTPSPPTSTRPAGSPPPTWTRRGSPSIPMRR